MSQKVFADFVGKISTDAAFRAHFEDAPHAVASRVGLSATELTAMLTKDADAVQVLSGADVELFGVQAFQNLNFTNPLLQGLNGQAGVGANKQQGLVVGWINSSATDFVGLQTGGTASTPGAVAKLGPTATQVSM